MITTHNLGFPRIGNQRQLKFALEAYWRDELTEQELDSLAVELRQQHWQWQSELDWVPVGDFSFYDQVLDMSFTLGNLPERLANLPGSEKEHYFRAARGRASKSDQHHIAAAEMTKWFDSNYHYLVPEFSQATVFKLNPQRLLNQLNEAKKLKLKAKPVIIGPITYLALGKSKDASNKLALVEKLLPAYCELLDLLAEQGVEWVQIDEPILVTELEDEWQQAFKTAYEQLSAHLPKLLLTTYFGQLRENLSLVRQLPVHGVHIDAVNAQEEVETLVQTLAQDKVISLGIINGRNIWCSDLNKLLNWLKPLYRQLGARLWLAPSCSLLHVPVDLEQEQQLAEDVVPWLSFAKQKLNELHILATALDNEDEVSDALKANQLAIDNRRQSKRLNNAVVQAAVQNINSKLGQRQSAYANRAKIQEQALKLPLLPTTTIGSFPQTTAIRAVRKQKRLNEIDSDSYREKMQAEIADCIRQQETLGLDVLVHGEAERNDMVEYFGQQLAGFVFSDYGWVQSYGSRCVKPPIIVGDVHRPRAMTVEWTAYAQTLTKKPVKGMLTGPVTILNWSFIRDDLPAETICRQIALAIRAEVQDLEKSGHKIIQIDEAALREGLPLRKSDWQHYLNWAVESFRIAANGVADSTQIHTHMCYSEFNDIIDAIAAMDADVITIESSRSDGELLQAFESSHYPNAIGPGVFDIHSPNTPSEEEVIAVLQTAKNIFPVRQLWVNPDCGLKTRRWEEVAPALKNMVAAAQRMRYQLS